MDVVEVERWPLRRDESGAFRRLPRDDDASDDPEEPADEEPWDGEDEDEALPDMPYAADPAAVLGWRGRAVALAVLEALKADWEWSIAASGRDVAAAWIARTLPLFEGWPPDVPGVDDAVG